MICDIINRQRYLSVGEGPITIYSLSEPSLADGFFMCFLPSRSGGGLRILVPCAEILHIIECAAQPSAVVTWP